MNWKISEKDQLLPEDVDRRGSKMLIGNGYIGYRGTLEEFNKEQKTATIVSGLYDQVGDQWREPVNLPNGGWVQVRYDGELLHALDSKVVAHTQTVNMKDATHERETVFAAADGAQITIRSRRFASLARHHLLCMEYSVQCDRLGTLEICAGIDGDVWDINGPHLCNLVSRETDGVITVTAVTHENRVRVAVSEAMTVVGGTPKITIKPNETHIGRQFTVENGVTLHKFVAHHTELDVEDPLTTGRELCQEAAALGFESLLAEHAALWAERWENCDIEIIGDPAAEEAVRFSMYHLLSIVPSHTDTASIPARGMSGQMYKGAIFWDTEIFMLPFFVHTFPELARNLLLYRYHTLEGARRKAQEYGYRGAFYAWESQDNGDDACTLFNVTDVFTNRPMRTYFRDKQVHISADVAYAFWHYFTLTGDATIWTAGGAEVVFECARFFISYAYYNPDKRRYEILDVTGPDEYHERVHNNVFTNRMVGHTLDVCLQLVAYLQENAPDFLQTLVAKLDFASDLLLVKEIAADLYQPETAAEGYIIPQFDGYLSLEDVALQALLERKLHPHEYLGGGCGLATTTQIIKQADVVLMLYLFGDQYPLAQKMANWEYYESRTEHGSSLSACSYSMVAAEIGQIKWAYKYFMKTATIDLTGVGKQYVGTLYIGGTHPAGNGGAWMSLVFGLCGIRCTAEGMAINGRLPAQWDKVTLPLTYRGQKLKITLTHEMVTIQPITCLTAPLAITVGEREYTLSATGQLVVYVATAVQELVGEK